METLTGLDATFLYLESPEMPMHVGSFNLCELPKGFRGSFHKAVTKHMASRLHLAPVFSRKLVFMPLDLGHPLWVEADSVDISFHVRRVEFAHVVVELSQRLRIGGRGETGLRAAGLDPRFRWQRALGK